MDLLSASVFQSLIPGLQNLLPETPLDLLIGCFMTDKNDSKYVAHGENSFKIVNNEIESLQTIAYELLSHVFDTIRTKS